MRTSVRVNGYAYGRLREYTGRRFYNLLDEFLMRYDYDEYRILRELRPYLKKEVPPFYKTQTIILPGLYLRFLKSLAGLADTTLSDIVNAIIQKIEYDLEKESYASRAF